jgi:hypothetical protein
MATFPTIETALLEIHQSLGLKQGQSDTKRKFSSGQMQLINHQKMGEQVLWEIFDELELDEQARAGFVDDLVNIGNAYKGLVCNTWTFNADQRQVFWLVLGHFFTPGIARHAAFWNLGANLDRGMPRGSFWYLPEVLSDENETDVYLPVSQVVDWLSDLAGGSIERLAECRIRAGNVSDVDDTETFIRTLYNWRKGTLPYRDKIHYFFSDDFEIQFAGSFELDRTQVFDHQFAETLRFVERKKLDEQALRKEIAIGDEQDIKRIISGHGTKNEKQHFVELVADRYQRPTPKIIRQRLLFARMIQDGYDRALRFLCPGVEKSCSDFEQNKLLQVFAIYKHIYNLTIAAWRNCRVDGKIAEDEWFEERLEPWDAYTLYMSILPSKHESGILELASLLNRVFGSMVAGADIQDLIGYDASSREHVTKAKLGLITSHAEETIAISKLIDRLKTASPWRTLQSEDRYSVVTQVAGTSGLSPKARSAAIERLKELAETPGEQLQPILLELDGYLNGDRRKLPKDSATQVEKLLAKAKANPSFDQWEAPILQYEAKHHLAKNDFKRALKLFDAARKAVLDTGFGSLRGEIARDGFAVQVADQKLIPNNHEIYYREMLAGGVIEEEKAPGIEEVAKWASEYFWNDLYKPYPGLDREKPVGNEELKPAIDVFISGDINAIKDWINLNHKKYNKSLHYVTGDSLLLSWIKCRSHLQDQLPKMKQIAPMDLQPELQRMERNFDVWRQAIKLLAQKGPKQLTLTDFKGQSPLMLVAEAGDSELVQAFLEAGASPDLQDFQGKSAFHAAVKSYDKASIDALLSHRCDLSLKTVDGRSALHTATWSGNTYATKKVIELSPQLASQRDSNGMTPLELAKFYCETPGALSYLNAELVKEGRKPVPAEQIEKLITALQNAPAVN